MYCKFKSTKYYISPRVRIIYCSWSVTAPSVVPHCFSATGLGHVVVTELTMNSSSILVKCDVKSCLKLVDDDLHSIVTVVTSFDKLISLFFGKLFYFPSAVSVALLSVILMQMQSVVCLFVLWQRI